MRVPTAMTPLVWAVSGRTSTRSSRLGHTLRKLQARQLEIKVMLLLRAEVHLYARFFSLVY